MDRSRIRWIALGALALVGATVGVLAFLHHTAGLARERAIERFESEVGPLDPAAWLSPRVPDVENAARAYRAAAQAFQEEVIDHRRPDELSQLEEWSESERAEVRGLLTSIPRTLEFLEEARRRPGSSWGSDLDTRLEALSRDGLVLLRLQRTLALAARDAIESRHGERLVAAAQTSAAIPATLRGEATVIGTLLAGAVERGALSMLRDGLAAGPSEETVRGLADAHRRLEEAARPLSDTFGGEAASLWAAGRFDPTAEPADVGGRIRRWFGGWGEVRASAVSLDIYRELASSSSVPFVELEPRLAPGSGPKVGVASVLRGILMPNMLDMIGKEQAVAASRRLAAAALWTRLEGLQVGEYPASVPPELDLPSVYNGEALSYEIATDGAVRIAYPLTQELRDEREPGDGPQARTPLSWTLPPLDPPTAPTP